MQETKKLAGEYFRVQPKCKNPETILKGTHGKPKFLKYFLRITYFRTMFCGFLHSYFLPKTILPETIQSESELKFEDSCKPFLLLAIKAQN